MSLDVSLYAVRTVEVYDGNITHNCADMAKAVGIYKLLWRPKETEGGNVRAGKILGRVKEGLAKLKEDPDYYRQFEPDNGWGTYNQFVAWLEEYVRALEENPDAVIEVSR